MKGTSRSTLALALALVPGIGGKTVTRVLTRNDLMGVGPEEFLRLGPEALREEYGLTRRQAEAWTEDRAGRLDEASALQARLDPLGVTMVTAADAHYPHRLEQSDPDPPGVLYVYGNLRLWERETFAVLASKHAPPAAADLMERLAEEHVLAGRVLVGSTDTAEYQRAAVVPLRWGAPRVLVLDTGLFQALGEDLREEPFAAARLWRYRFDPTTDLVVSPVNPLRPYHRQANRIRDRVVAGLAGALDFVWIAPGRNMERLAHAALRAGRAVRVSDLFPEYRTFRAQGARVLTG